MTKLFFRTAFVVFCVAAFPQEILAQQRQAISARQIAALIEEVTALRDEVNRLRLDVEDLRAENARLLEKAGRKGDNSKNAAEIASLRVEVNNKLEAQRREIGNEIEKRIARVNEETNKALKNIQKQVNDALDTKSVPAAPAAKPKDLPENGILYVVKSGDTLSRIAREHNSKIAWILFVNQGLNPNRLQPGKEIVIPQKD